jgi:hypothetical protein
LFAFFSQQSKRAENPKSVTGGEVNFRKDVLSFSSTKDGQYSPLKAGNSLFSWHISPLFDFATSTKCGQEANNVGIYSPGAIGGVSFVIIGASSSFLKTRSFWFGFAVSI